MANNNYEKEWKIIDSLEQQGLPQSALQEVLKLYERAKEEKNPAQLIKILLYREKYRIQLEEDGMVKAIGRLRQEMEEEKFPVRPMLQSILAEIYQRYADENYWQFEDRTTIADSRPEDIRTWSLEQITEESSRLYWASVREEQLKEVPVENFDAITLDGREEKGLRPTLYDFLAHRAIDHFMNERTYLSAPAYEFHIDQETAFVPASQFVNLEFITPDTASFKRKALLLFQDLLRFHQQDADPAALIDADLKRLQFVLSNSIHERKDELFLAALHQLETRYSSHPSVTEVMHKQAQWYARKGREYEPGASDETRWALKKAMAICEDAIRQFPESFGARQCEWLKTSILRKSLQLRTEEVNLPGQSILALVEYQNVRKTYIKVVSLDQADRDTILNQNLPEQIEILNRLPAVQNFSSALPDESDYQPHSAELRIAPLPHGLYGVLISDDPSFETKGHNTGFLFTYVSKIGYLHRQSDKGEQEFLVLDRDSGQPLEGVLAEFFNSEYNPATRRSQWKKIGQAHSDKEGIVRPDLPEQRYFQVRFSKGEDQLFLWEGYSSYSYDTGRQPRQMTEFFLDRGIYRPGQTVYFKGIVLEKDENDMPRILADEKVTVTLYDVNAQKVTEQTFRTNVYGTFNGAFTAPQTGLLGAMYLESSLGGNTRYFRVEEYKRPKFEVTFQPLEGSFALDDEVTVKGQARAFAGSNIDGATVKFRVVREVHFPWFPWWRVSRFNPYRIQNTEISFGETRTDAEGAFSITFKALADPSVDPALNPAFRFVVYADVVDITGETHSAEKTVNLGYISLQAEVQIPEKLDRKAANTVRIVTRNLDGQFEPAEGSLTITRLQSPGQYYLDRYWTKPDQPVLSEQEFKTYFPLFAYRSEDDPSQWPKLDEHYQETFNTGKSDSVVLNTASWPVGQYELRLLTRDGHGKEVEIRKIISLYDSEEGLFPKSILGWHQLAKPTLGVGEEANLNLGTGSDALSVLFELARAQDMVHRQWLDVKGWQTVTHPIREQDRGNIAYQLTYLKHNRCFTEQGIIYVPWSEKELTIEYGTFRDKLRPGQEEEWVVRIGGPENERVAAEMVATLYDASLDQFEPNSWPFFPYPMLSYFYRSWSPKHFSAQAARISATDWQPSVPSGDRQYRNLNWFGFYGYYTGGFGPELYRTAQLAQAAPTMDFAAKTGEANLAFSEEEEVPPPPAIESEPDTAAGERMEPQEQPTPEAVRTNLNETVFFLPDLRTDEQGNIVIRFTMNEALTRWRFMGLAHTQDLKFGYTEKSVLTQKELMVLPNPPRFVREGDHIEFTAKVSNLSGQKLEGEAMLQLFDAQTMKPVDDLLDNTAGPVAFSVEGGQSARLAWTLRIPEGGLSALTHRVVAKAGAFSDGEESTIPVLTNRMLVTESMPMQVRGKETRLFHFTSLDKAEKSETLAHHQMTLEFTSNPAWYAVQALPYLMEYPYECVEQIFNRYYANSLATAVANAHPRIREVFQAWKDTETLESNLQKNQELKAVLLEETPWVLAAQSEAEQRRNIGLLFDLERMSNEQLKALNQIAEKQSPGGGFPWFAGGPESWYITQYIVEGFGHLNHLGVADIWDNPLSAGLLESAIRFTDQKAIEEYRRLEEQVQLGKAKWEDDHLGSLLIHYLYTRSFFPEIEMEDALLTVYQYYQEQAEQYWLQKGLYHQGMIALALHRAGRGETPGKILRSLQERALRSEELGMYWKYPRSYFWHELPVETHALMIELFTEMGEENDAAVEELKIWLLKNKQTNHWETTKATAAAVYALLIQGEDLSESEIPQTWLIDEAQVEITFPDLGRRQWKEKLAEAQQSAEKGTGYFKTSWEGEGVSAEMSRIRIKNPNRVVSWGSMYWQYFEDLDKVTVFEDTPLQLKKQLFREEPSDKGPVLKAISEMAPLEPGDKLIVRIELRVDRDMEYVHMKDHRASGLEPVSVLSHYKWQGGLGYYESTRDAATHFFFDYLPQGTYVFEYPLRVIHQGNFSNGVTLIQCMYAPEFTSHSEGVRLKVSH